jgi:hypothetical protein
VRASSKGRHKPFFSLTSSIMFYSRTSLSLISIVTVIVGHFIIYLRMRRFICKKPHRAKIYQEVGVMCWLGVLVFVYLVPLRKMTMLLWGDDAVQGRQTLARVEHLPVAPAIQVYQPHPERRIDLVTHAQGSLQKGIVAQAVLAEYRRKPEE